MFCSHMDSKQNATTNSSWNHEKMESEEHDQIPMGVGIWPNYYQHQPLPTQPSSSSNFLSDVLGIQLEEDEDAEEELGAMKEMMYKMAAMQPVDIDPASVRKPKRRNVRISDDPQSVAARHRRERISEKIRILQRLVPGGTKLDTASMLDEAIRYVKFLKRQIRLLQLSTPPPLINCIPPCPFPSPLDMPLINAMEFNASSIHLKQSSGLS